MKCGHVSDTIAEAGRDEEEEEKVDHKWRNIL